MKKQFGVCYLCDGHFPVQRVTEPNPKAKHKARQDDFVLTDHLDSYSKQKCDGSGVAPRWLLSVT